MQRLNVYAGPKEQILKRFSNMPEICKLNEASAHRPCT